MTSLLRTPSILALLGLLAGCTDADLPVAQGFELERFQGRWFEISRIPRDYDELCHDTVADYRLVGPGEVEMTHRCHIGATTGSVTEFRAKASADDAQAPAKLSLDLGLYRGAYWVLDVGENYDYAVIGHPSLSMLWILSRTPTLEPSTLQHALEVAQRDGFSTERLRATPQSGALTP